jgi:hypothetical protein
MLQAQISQTQSEKRQLQSRANRYTRHEFSVYAVFGSSNINYRLAGKSYSAYSDYAVNYNLKVIPGVSYAYNFNNHIAIVTGLSVTNYTKNLTLGKYSADYTAYDNRGDKFTMHYSLTSEYREQQTIVLFAVPLMFRYSIPLSRDGTKYFISSGIQAGFPLISNTTITPGSIFTSGSYEYEARVYTDLLEYGFVDGYSGERTTGRLNLDIIPIFSIETGLRLPVGYTTALTMGLYLDHSLSSLQGSNDKQIVEYQSLVPSRFVYNSVLNTAAISKITLFNIGLKIGLAF